MKIHVLFIMFVALNSQQQNTVIPWSWSSTVHHVARCTISNYDIVKFNICTMAFSHIHRLDTVPVYPRSYFTKNTAGKATQGCLAGTTNIIII